MLTDEDMPCRSKRLMELKEARWISVDNEDEYIRESEKYIREHIPKKAIQHYLPPNMVFLKDEFYSLFLSRLIEKYHEVESYRNMIANGSTDPIWQRELKRAEELGF